MATSKIKTGQGTNVGALKSSLEGWEKTDQKGKKYTRSASNKNGHEKDSPYNPSNKVNTNTIKQTNKHTNMKKATGATATIQTPAKTTATTSKATAKNTTNKTKGAIKGKTQPDYTIHSYQELAKMYGNGFVGKNKQTLIDELTARAVVGSN